MSRELARATTSGVMWSGLSQFLRQVVQLVVVAILARLLLPEEFGVIAMAVFFTGLIGRVALGFRFSIIQRKDISQSQLSTLFWAGLAAGVVMWAISAAVSPLAASFFGNDRVRPVLIVLAAGFIINSFGLVQSGLLHRNLEFRKLAVVDVTGALAAGLLSIWLAIAHLGVWSLVWGDLLGNSIMAILLWRLSPWRPGFHCSLKSLRDLFGFGAAVTGNSMVNYVGTDIDRLLVGRLLGSSVLGLFSQASRLAQLPRLNISQIVTSVTFPAFSRIQDDDIRLQYGYLKSLAYISIVTFPLLAGLAVVAPEFVGVVYGGRWVDMVLSLQILCVAGMASSLGTTVGSIAFSKGRADLLLKLNLVKVPFYVAAMLLGARYGIVGVATAISVETVGETLVVQVFTNRLIKLRMKAWFQSFLPATLGILGMVAVLIPLRWLAITSLTIPNVTLLLSLVVIGAATYLLTLRIARTKELNEILQLFGDVLMPYIKTIPSRIGRKPTSSGGMASPDQNKNHVG